VVGHRAEGQATHLPPGHLLHPRFHSLYLVPVLGAKQIGVLYFHLKQVTMKGTETRDWQGASTIVQCMNEETGTGDILFWGA
jgi:hypothetical protein